MREAIMLDRDSLAIRHAASTDEGRYQINCVKIDEKQSVATNGSIMAVCRHPEFSPLDYPAGTYATATLADALIPLDALDRADKAIPKKSHIPILATARIALGDTCELVAGDIGSPSKIETRRIDGSFPDWQRMWPRTEPTMIVTFDLALLNQLVKSAGPSAKGKLITLGLTDAKSVMQVLINDVESRWRGILMPCSTSRHTTASFALPVDTVPKEVVTEATA
jgi:DNA polymerase III sliding clamp (beta) subunit (PCNA family)